MSKKKNLSTFIKKSGTPALLKKQTSLNNSHSIESIRDSPRKNAPPSLVNISSINSFPSKSPRKKNPGMKELLTKKNERILFLKKKFARAPYFCYIHFSSKPFSIIAKEKTVAKIFDRAKLPIEQKSLQYIQIAVFKEFSTYHPIFVKFDVR